MESTDIQISRYHIYVPFMCVTLSSEYIYFQSCLCIIYVSIQLESLSLCRRQHIHWLWNYHFVFNPLRTGYSSFLRTRITVSRSLNGISKFTVECNWFRLDPGLILWDCSILLFFFFFFFFLNFVVVGEDLIRCNGYLTW